MIVRLWNKLTALKIFRPIDIFSPTCKQVVFVTADSVLTDRMCLLLTDRRHSATDTINRQTASKCMHYVFEFTVEFSTVVLR